MNNIKLTIVLASILIVLLALIFLPKIAKAFPVVGVGVVVTPSDYQECINTCLAYNGYDSDTYSFCQSSCLYPDPVVIVGPVWVHGRYYPHGYGRNFSPRHDGHDYNGRR